MKKYTSLLFLLTVFAVASLSGCSSFDTVEEPVVVANGGGGEAGKINDVPVVTPQERRDPTPITVPRATQAQVIGVVRELRANGCIIQKVATTDGIHYSQLLVTCGEPQTPPVQ